MALIIRQLGLRDYLPVFEAMQSFTQHRTGQAQDELWCVEHSPVFTQGRAGKSEHILNANNIPIVQTDRGGQVTYHGPGQAVIYLLCDLNRLAQGTQAFVTLIEQSIIETLSTYAIQAVGDNEARGVYVNNKKIASIGLRITKKGCYHGLALNVDMDLSPFSQINPCGYTELKMTQLSELASETPSLNQVFTELSMKLAQKIGYCDIISLNSINEPLTALIPQMNHD